MTKLLKIAGITASKQASGIKVDELGRIELSRTVEPKRIIGNVLEPYAEDYKGPVSVFGLELYAINSERSAAGSSYSLPTPDGWLMSAYGSLLRYDSKGAIIWEAEGRVGGVIPIRDRLVAIRGGHIYSVTRYENSPNFSYKLDKISYKTGKVEMAGGILEGINKPVDLVYSSNIDRLVGVVEYPNNRYGLIYVHPDTLEVVSSVDNFTNKLASIFSVAQINSGTYLSCENGNIYIHIDNKGTVTAKLDVDIEVSVQRLVKNHVNTIVTTAGFVVNGDVYSTEFGGRSIYRNGVVIHTQEIGKVEDIFRGGIAGNLALLSDGNKVLAFDKDILVMSVEIPHNIAITNIAGDSMGNIFVGTTGGIYILGDTLQIKGYQLVV